jgi:aminomethyltransferase
MKHTAFTKFHEQTGARMVPFAGYYMPLQFEGINAEHEHVRTKLGVFDVSHMGEIWVKGPRAEAFTQFVTSNDVSILYDGKVQYSCFPNDTGGIVDDLLVYKVDSETFLLVVNASNIEKDWNWLCKHAPAFNIEIGKELYNASDEIAQLAVQGPLALKAMQKICPVPIEDMEYYTFKKFQIAGADVIFSTTGYTGSGGCEIYMDNQDAEKIWHAVFEAGKEFDIKPIGLAARDTLRLEMGFCLYGNDINETTSPIEAGLGWITKFNDNNNFVYFQELLRQKQDGPKKSLRGFEMIDKAIPRQHYIIKDAQGKPIGEVTSGTMGPSVKKAVGMGYIDSAYAKIGMEIFIDIRGKLNKAVIVKLPFYKG